MTRPVPDLPETQPLDPDAIAAPEMHILTLNRSTGKVYEEDLPGLQDLLRPYTDAGVGLEELLEAPEEVPMNFGDWVQVADPTAGTYPRVVNLKMWARDTDGVLYGPFGCSGTLIDPMHVLTAAHCIYFTEEQFEDHSFEGYIEDVQVIPAYQDGNEPFGHTGFADLHVWTNWSADHDRAHDVGVIDLVRPVGALTGWWGYGYNEDCGFWTYLTWVHVGYPGAPLSNGEFMFSNSGDFDSCYPLANQVTWDNSSWHGTSGAGAVKTSTGAVYAVHSSSLEDHSTDCVITDVKFSQISQMISDDKPGTLDLRAMDVHSQDAVESGERPDHFDFAVLNYSHGTGSGDWGFHVYLSDNAIFTSVDELLGSYTFNYAFGDNGIVRVDMTAPLIPADTPSGDYYLGVMLTDVDANISNNPSDGIEAWPITITCPGSTTPTQLGPIDGTDCLDESAYFDWSVVAPLADYELRIGCTGYPDRVIGTRQTWYVVEDLPLGTGGWWQVRAMAQCGSWGAWSPAWVFATKPDPAIVPGPTYPADGEHCVDPVMTLSWDSLPHTVGYEMQIGDACGTGLVRSLSLNHLDLLLNAGTTYYWKVRAHNDCDEWTNWSPCYVFRTATAVAMTPSQAYPPDGTDCVAAESGLGWSDDPDAASWDVELGEVCGEGTIFNVAEHHLYLSNLSDGVTYYWRVRVHHECGLVSGWSPCRSFSVDLAAPTVPTNLVPSHAVGVWSNDDTIYVDWDAATDNCWTPGYSYVFDHSPMTIPDNVPDLEEPGTVSDPLPDGDDHWFHVKAVDGAGNVSDTVHLGPFRIDTTGPTEPQFEYTTVEPGDAFGVAPFIVDWTASSDEASGVAGYSWWLDIDPAPLDQPDLVVETTATTLSGELELEGALWFFLRAVDAVGNGSDIAALGPFICDHNLLGVGFLSPTRVDVLTEGDVFPISWWMYDDGGAVLQMGRLEYSLDAGDSYEQIGNLTPSQVESGTVNWTVPAVGSQEAVLRLSVWDTEGRVVRIRTERFTINQVTGVGGEPAAAPDCLVLGNAQPNPFNASTTIHFDLPLGVNVQLCIYDSRGRRVRTLLDGWRDGPRRYNVTWDGIDDHGGQVVSGVYLYQLRAGDQVETKRLTLVK